VTKADSLLAELAREAQISREHLERLPGGKLDWRPDPTSPTAGQLASQMVDSIRWTGSIFGTDEFDIDPSRSPFQASSLEALLQAFDAEVDQAKRALAGVTDAVATQTWRLRMHGTLWLEKPRDAAFHEMTLSRLVRQRQQLSSYLQRLGVAPPGA